MLSPCVLLLIPVRRPIPYNAKLLCPKGEGPLRAH
jgi:hypothetical protein